MPAFTNPAENALIDWLFRGAAAPALPPSWFFGLLSAIPGDDPASFTEISGGAYARVQVQRTMAVFAGTQGPGSTVASAGDSAATSNNVMISWPAPTADWGQVRGIAIFDAPIGGTPWFCAALAEPKTIRAGDAPPSFPPGTFSFTLDAS